jgi:hypothetical protein
MVHSTRNVGIFGLVGLCGSYAILRARSMQHKVHLPGKGDFTVHISRSGKLMNVNHTRRADVDYNYVPGGGI